MDANRQRELTLKRDAAKRTAEERARQESFRTLIEPLDAIGARYVVIPPGGDLLHASSALAALELFPFDSYGHLDTQKSVPKSEWRTVLSDEFCLGRRAYLAWKDWEYCVDVLLPEIIPALSNLFVEYQWDAYLFDPFGNWIVESHHNGYLATIGAEQVGRDQSPARRETIE